MLASFRRVRALLPLACLTAACGGNVVVDEPGAGGAGGAPVTTTSTSTVSSASTSISTSSGASECDNTGDCGDASSGCAACAVNGPCADLFVNCENEPACVDVAGCLGPCSPEDFSCIHQCAAQSPEGAQVYSALLDCVICTQCPIDCANAPYADPSPGCP